MISLVWGCPSDPPTAAVLTALARTGAPTLFVDQSAWRDTEFIAATSLDEPHGALRTPNGLTQLRDVTSAYLRPTRLDRRLAEAGASETDRGRLAALEAGLVAWADAAPGTILNRPASMASNNSKPYQSALIHRAGFSVPESLLTTDPGALEAFHRRHGALIYKSASGVRSIVGRYDPSDRSRSVGAAACPTMFQRYIPGRDIRVHVVGAVAFAVEIVSTATDYRYPDTELERPSLRAIQLPQPLAARCVDLAAALDLTFAGIDLRHADDGDWVCFEVNPSPGFTYYEDAAGVPIAASVANLLAKHWTARATETWGRDQRAFV